MQVAVIIPWSETKEILPPLLTIRKQLADCARLWPQIHYDYWLIDDGTATAIRTQLCQAQARWPECHLLTLSRHFGFLGAAQAGLATATADAYLILDVAYPAQFAAIPQLLAAMNDGGCAIVGFTSEQPRHWWGQEAMVTFHDCLVTTPAKRALLQAAARAGFSLELLAEIGFKQKLLAWSGPWPKSPHTSRWPWAAVVGAVIFCGWWWPSAVALNVILSGVVLWQWRQQRQRLPRIGYVVSSIQR